MTLEHTNELFQYNRWANARVRKAGAALSPAQQLQDLGNSFRSIRDTLAHIYGAEWIWLERWLGVSPPALPAADQFPTVAALETPWIEVERRQAEFIERLDAAALERTIAYTNTKGRPFAYSLRHMLAHVVNHSTYHRGQITTMLRQLGAPPVSTDLLLFFDEIGEGGGASQAAVVQHSGGRK